MLGERVKKIVSRADLLLLIYILALHGRFLVMKNSMVTQTKPMQIHITVGIKYHGQKPVFHHFSKEYHWRVLTRQMTQFDIKKITCFLSEFTYWKQRELGGNCSFIYENITRTGPGSDGGLRGRWILEIF